MGKPAFLLLRQRRREFVAKMQTIECPDSAKVDPRVRRTRALLEDAMQALLAEKSYNDISVSDIAARATVNRATFYAHFDDKKALTASLLRRDIHVALRASLTQPTPMGTESLTRVAIALFEFVARTFRACPKHADEFAPIVGPTIQEGVQDFLRLWLEMDPEAIHCFPIASKDTVASVLGWGLYGGALRWSRAAKRPPAERAAREVVSLLLRPKF
jgi:AcrR family transcriptional regulator